MNTLTQRDLSFVASRIPKDIRELIQKENILIAGGFIRSTISGEKVSDVDLFGSSKEKLEALAYKLCTERKGNIHKTDNALTLLKPPRLPIQFITRWVFNEPIEILNSFDFTICQAVMWYKNEKWESCISENFYPDLAAHRLIYASPKRNEDAGGSLLRVRKFLKKGYNIQADSLSKVVARLIKDIDTEKVKINDESQTSTIICSLLREVDPLIIVDGIDPVDEHEIINKE